MHLRVLSVILSVIQVTSFVISPNFIKTTPTPTSTPTSTSRTTHLPAVTPVFDEVCDTTGVTLTRFMHEVERVNPELQELAQLFSGVRIAVCNYRYL